MVTIDIVYHEGNARYMIRDVKIPYSSTVSWGYLGTVGNMDQTMVFKSNSP